MENKQQPVVNICGSCILRDTFYYQGVYGKEKDGGYRINRYVNFFSPLALEQPPIPIYDRKAYEAFDAVRTDEFLPPLSAAGLRTQLYGVSE